MNKKIDSLDLKIISQLRNNGRVSLVDLAEKIGVSRQTVANRFKRLVDDGLVIINGGLDLKKFGFKMACVGLEVNNEITRRELENSLMNCPRILSSFRTPEKANIHLEVWAEDDSTLTSTIESFRDLANVDIVYTHYLGTPIHGNFLINMTPNPSDITPCGGKCVDCHRYINEWCVGCLKSSDYKNPLLTS